MLRCGKDVDDEEIFFRMYFLDDWVSLQVGELLGSGAWLILGFPIYSLFYAFLFILYFRLSYLFSIYSL